MKLENKEKRQLKIILLAIIFYFVLLRIDSVAMGLTGAVSLLKPFIIGGILAFIINVPMVKVEKQLEKTKMKKGRRGLAFLITLALLLAAVAMFLTIVVPQLVQALSTLADHLQLLTD